MRGSQLRHHFAAHSGVGRALLESRVAVCEFRASVVDSVVPKIPVFEEEFRGRDRNKGTSAYNQYDPTNDVSLQQYCRVSRAPDLHTSRNAEGSGRWIVEFGGGVVIATASYEHVSARKERRRV